MSATHIRLLDCGDVETGSRMLRDAGLGADVVHALRDDVVVFWITSASGPS
jgi:hypothetical protein